MQVLIWGFYVAGPFSTAFLLKAVYTADTFSFAWHLYLTQLVNVYFVLLAGLGLETFVMDAHGLPRFTYIALSHSVSSIVVTGAMVATVLYSYTYSSFQSGPQALLWSWTGYCAAAAHLLFVVVHNTADIPIDFYLPTPNAKAPASLMIGFGYPFYADAEMILLVFCVAVFLWRNGVMKWGLFGITVCALNYVTVNNLVFSSLDGNQYLLLMGVSVHVIPLWAYWIEQSSRNSSARSK